ncbi:MAG: hypothetical protein PHQ69_10535 [Bacteroidales bacterium]|nr:hypothetical protein [Bacteroidales bacterium]
MRFFRGLRIFFLAFFSDSFLYLCAMMPMLFMALPVLDEYDSIRHSIRLFQRLDYPLKKLYVCVNQPDNWHGDPTFAAVTARNRMTLAYLSALHDDRVVVMDNASPGKGWTGRRQGVGMARRQLMEAITAVADPGDIIVSMDADTDYPASYFSMVSQRLSEFPSAMGLAVPYFHVLPEDVIAARAILRYEVYMRYYALQLYFRNLPYARSALGSAFAVPVRAYKRVGGITPHNGGEDFYFLQKLAKAGPVLDYCSAVVAPSARFSSRVPIGTGPALIRGAGGDWTSYPFYAEALFDEVKQTFDAFPALFRKDLTLPMTPFLKEMLKTDDLWGPLRANYPSEELFVRACYTRIDGLRIRQYLRYRYLQSPGDNLEALNTFLRTNYATFVPVTGFEHTDTDKLERIRRRMFEAELQQRRMHDEKYRL